MSLLNNRVRVVTLDLCHGGSPREKEREREREREKIRRRTRRKRRKKEKARTAVKTAAARPKRCRHRLEGAETRCSPPAMDSDSIALIHCLSFLSGCFYHRLSFSSFFIFFFFFFFFFFFIAL